MTNGTFVMLSASETSYKLLKIKLIIYLNIKTKNQLMPLRSCFKFTLNIISVVVAKPFPIKIKEKRLWQSSVLYL